jgi:hypothetical protein
MNGTHLTSIEKESIEVKLPEPYNSCRESSVNERYHRWNCIESCVHRQIEAKYNCSYSLGLFAGNGHWEMCDVRGRSFFNLTSEFLGACHEECPLESCFSEKFTHEIQTFSGDSFTSFRFYFHDLSSLNVSQIPKIDGVTFINNVGGGLGLFMGIAFPTLIEFLQFVCEVLAIAFIR